MYIKIIYDNWQLHPDATQLEINYRFLTLFVDIADTKRLTTTSASTEVLQDAQLINDWKQWKFEQVYKDFRQISTTEWPDSTLFNHENYLIRCLFILAFILNALKTTNYKASELEVYYEPRLFAVACEHLSLEILEEWVSVLYLRLSNLNDSQPAVPFNCVCDWKINYVPKHFKNTVWFLDNLGLTFKTIFTWFETQIPHLKNDQTKTGVINIMNHFIVYALTDFYLKYYIEMNNASFQKNYYNHILLKIRDAINDHSFAFLSYQAIASFLGLLLSNELLTEHDDLIANFIKLSNISSSLKNREKFHELMFDTKYEKLTDVKISTPPASSSVQKTTPFAQIFTTELPPADKPADKDESIDEFLEDLIK